jgi:purine-binding chemotaxis protein CheW
MRKTSVAVLLFDIGGRRYGLFSAAVDEIVRAVPPVPLPGAPAVVEGVIDVRGSLRPVFDVRGRLGLPAKPLEPSDHLILARAGARPVAIRADRAAELAEVAETDIADAKRIVAGAERIAGIARLSDGLVLIYDLAAFLSEAEAAALDCALREKKEAGP